MKKIKAIKPKAVSDYNSILEKAFSEIKPIDSRVKAHLSKALKFNKKIKRNISSVKASKNHSLDFNIVNQLEIDEIGKSKSFSNLPKGIRIVAATR